jgi:hypothetical protein
MATRPDRNYEDDDYARNWYDNPRRRRSRSQIEGDWEREQRQQRPPYDNEPHREDWPTRYQGQEWEGARSGYDSDRERFRTRGRSPMEDDLPWRNQEDRWNRSEYQRTNWSTREHDERRPWRGSRPQDRYLQQGRLEHEGRFDTDDPYTERWQSGRDRRYPSRDWQYSERDWRPDGRDDRYSGYGNTYQERTTPYDYPGIRGTQGSSFGGPFTGRGPKGYKRSDDRTTDDVCDRLERDGAIDASEIEIDCKDGVVTLKGTVPDRETKRRAEEAAERTYGVKDVMNQIRVEREQHGSGNGKENERQNERHERPNQRTTATR